MKADSGGARVAAWGSARVVRASRTQLPLAALLLGTVLWGLAWWPLQSLHALGIGGVALTLVAYGAGGAVLLLAAWRQKLPWQGFGLVIGLIFLVGGYANLSYTVAIVYGNPIRVMLLFYLAPIWTVIGARLFLGERVDGMRAAAVLMAIIGAFLVLGGPRILRAAPSLNDLLAVSAGFSYAMNNLAYRSATALSVTIKNAALFAGAALLALLALPLAGESASSASATVWLWGAVFGVLWLIAATGVTQYGVTHLEAGRSAILLTLELPITAVSAAYIAGARLSAMEAAGGLLIVAAALLEGWKRR
ncbi:MAG: DMT family transporter [Chromatiales bacterium]